MKNLVKHLCTVDIYILFQQYIYRHKTIHVLCIPCKHGLEEEMCTFCSKMVDYVMIDFQPIGLVNR